MVRFTDGSEVGEGPFKARVRGLVDDYLAANKGKDATPDETLAWVMQKLPVSQSDPSVRAMAEVEVNNKLDLHRRKSGRDTLQ